MNEELMNTPIDRWGIAWQRFMETNYPEEIPLLKESGRWEVIPRLIDREAWQMWELLRKQYAKKILDLKLSLKSPLGRKHARWWLSTRLWSRLFCSAEDNSKCNAASRLNLIFLFSFALVLVGRRIYCKAEKKKTGSLLAAAPCLYPSAF